MADGDPVGGDEHVLRYARKKAFDAGKLNGSAFDRTPKDHDGVSVSRLGVFSQDRDEDIRLVRTAIASRLKLDKAGGLAELLVSDIVAVGEAVNETLRVLQNPLVEEPDKGWLPNRAHAVVDGLPFVGAAIGSLTSDFASDLLRRKVLALHPTIAS